MRVRFGEGVDFEGLAVGEGGDGTVAIGAEEADAGLGVAFDDGRDGLAKLIAFADGDSGEARRDGGEESGGGGRLAAVVRDFEEIGGERSAVGGELVFDRGLDITGEQEADAGVGEAEDEGIVVGGFRDLGGIGRP